MKINLDNLEDLEREESFDHAPRRRRKKKCHFLRILLSLILTFIIVGAIGFATLKFVVGPIVKTVDGLPSDFPSELAIYNIDDAKIGLQNPEGRQKVINGLRSMPDWVLTLFLNVLSDDLKLRLAENFGDDIDIPNNFNVDDLKNALKTTNLEDTKTINLSWDKVDKTKEEISAYYKAKLSEANFEFKENLEDYEINLGFWKDDIFGTMSFSDKKEDGKYNSDVDITVNYFNELNEN